MYPNIRNVVILLFGTFMVVNHFIPAVKALSEHTHRKREVGEADTDRDGDQITFSSHVHDHSKQQERSHTDASSLKEPGSEGLTTQDERNIASGAGSNANQNDIDQRTKEEKHFETPGSVHSSQNPHVSSDGHTEPVKAENPSSRQDSGKELSRQEEGTRAWEQNFTLVGGVGGQEAERSQSDRQHADNEALTLGDARSGAGETSPSQSEQSAAPPSGSPLDAALSTMDAPHGQASSTADEQQQVGGSNPEAENTLSDPAQASETQIDNTAIPPRQVPANHVSDAPPTEHSGAPSGTSKHTEQAEGDAETVRGSEDSTEEQESSGPGKNAETHDEELVVPNADEDIPSFDEWKARKLAEQKVKQNEVHQNGNGLGAAGERGGGGQNGTSATSASQAAASAKLKKNRVNNAAASCGAKVLATNTEAKNAASILTENRDQYMIQPCSANKWLVVQLCDPVQVESVELGNLELFSSLPKTFAVYVSDRYPTSHWELLATMHARDERSIQSFPVKDAPFAKYLKVEVLSHYEKEHYCPLSILRVYGLSVHEDTEDDDEEEAGSEDPGKMAATPADSDADAKTAINLFENAKDTVVSIINNVLNGNGHSEPASEHAEVMEDSPTPDELERQVRDGHVNATTNQTAAESQQQQFGPLSPNATAPGTNATPCAEEAAGPGAPDPGVDSHLPDRADSFVRLVESPRVPLPLIIASCKFCDLTSALSVCKMDRYSIYGYFSFVTFVYKTCCVDHVDSYTAKTVGDNNSEQNIKTEAQQKQDDVKVDRNHDQTQESTLASNKGADVVRGSEEQKNVDLKMEPAPGMDSKVNHPQAVSPDKDSSEVQGDANLENTSNNKEEVNPDLDTPADHSTEAHPNNEPPTMHGPDLVQIRPPIPNNDIDPTMNPNAEVTGSNPAPSDTAAVSGEASTEATRSEGEEAGGGREGGEGEGGAGEADAVHDDASRVKGDTGESNTAHPIAEPAQAEGEKDEVTEQDKREVARNGDSEAKKDGQTEKPKAEDRKPQIVQAEEAAADVAEEYDSGEEVQVGRLGSGSKETTYMKLKNKIKQLEVNLNLSSTYLEELSQRYKRRMEEMYVSLNRTIQRLTNTSKSAEIQDQKQQERISRLEAVVNNLSHSLHTMQGRLETTHEQLIERHMYLMLLEFAIFLFVMAWCLSRQKNHYRERIRTVSDTYFSTVATSQRASAKNESQKLEPGAGTNPNGSVTTEATSGPPASLTTPARGHRRVSSMDYRTPSRHREGVTPAAMLTPSALDEFGLRKTGSENDITIIAPNSQLFACKTPQVEDFPKKKKKKKTTQPCSVAHVTKGNHTTVVPPSSNTVGPSMGFELKSSETKTAISSKTQFSGNVSPGKRNSVSPIRRHLTESGPSIVMLEKSSPQTPSPPAPELMYRSSKNQYSLLPSLSTQKSPTFDLNTHSPTKEHSSYISTSNDLGVKDQWSSLCQDQKRLGQNVRRKLQVNGASDISDTISTNFANNSQRGLTNGVVKKRSSGEKAKKRDAKDQKVMNSTATQELAAKNGPMKQQNSIVHPGWFQ